MASDNIEKLYHVEVEVPDPVWKQVSLGLDLSLTPTNHAIEKSKDNKYLDFEDKINDNARIEIPSHVYVDKDDIFEIGVDKDGEVIKVGFRYPRIETQNCEGDYSDYELVLIVGLPEENVISLYLNDKNDTHASLDLSNYDTELP